MQKCPGQDTRNWTPDDVSEVECAGCGHMLEFFKTEGVRRCPQCGLKVINPAVSLGCAQWCDYAKECLGFDPKQLQAEDEGGESMAQKLIAIMKSEFDGDQKRISHALRVLERAEALLHEEDGSPRVVVAAALLHDIGIREAERKHGSGAPKYQEQEGPPIARRILEELDFDADIVDHICRIVGSHHSGDDIDTPEFRILWDADLLVNLEEARSDGDDATGRRLSKG